MEKNHLAKPKYLTEKWKDKVSLYCTLSNIISDAAIGFTFFHPLDLWVSDEGTYICEAENQFGRIQSRPAMITVTGLGKTD